MPQHWAMTESHLHFGPTPHGVSEVRYLLEGGYVMAGVRLSALPGENLQAKTEKLATEPGMRAFVTKAGGG
eukprot:8029271-Pyramimonas_sp.AAC.1